MRHISGAKTKVKDSKIRRHNTLANWVAENSIVESLLWAQQVEAVILDPTLRWENVKGTITITRKPDNVLQICPFLPRNKENDHVS